MSTKSTMDADDDDGSTGTTKNQHFSRHILLCSARKEKNTGFLLLYAYLSILVKKFSSDNIFDMVFNRALQLLYCLCVPSIRESVYKSSFYDIFPLELK